MRRILDNPRLVPLAIVAACLAILATAYASETWGGLKPCVLCYYQRYAYFAAAGLGFLGLLLGGRAGPRRALVGLAGLAFLAGAGTAFFHVGVEQLWWRGTAECHAQALDLSQSVEDLRKQMLETDFVACDKIAWSLFGISMAGYNVLASLGLGLASLWAARHMTGERRA